LTASRASSKLSGARLQPFIEEQGIMVKFPVNPAFPANPRRHDRAHQVGERGLERDTSVVAPLEPSLMGGSA
jgi:hypothetical protein